MISNDAIIILHFILTVPTVTTTIIPNGSPIIEEMFTLICNSAFPSSVEPTMVSYVWKKNGQVVAGQISNLLTTNPIQLADNNTAYTCESLLTSPYLSSTFRSTSEIYKLIIIGKSLNKDLLFGDLTENVF